MESQEVLQIFCSLFFFLYFCVVSSLTILCISPISIPNPNYGKNPLPGTPFALKDCTSKMLSIPCGHCPECIALKQMYLVQRVQMEAINNYLFFCTLTYNNKMLPKVVTSSGYEIAYADIRDIQLLFKRIRNNNGFTRPFKTLYVSELGSKRGRPHFHILFLLPKITSDNLSEFKDYGISEIDNEFTPLNLEKIMFDFVLSHWCRRVSKSKKFVEYEPCCTYQEIYRRGKRISNFDLHFVRPYFSEDSFTNVAFYVLKYMLKRSDRETRLQQALHLNLPKDEYEDIWSLVRSRCVCSKGFGLNLDSEGNIDSDILNHIKHGIKVSEDFPKFFNPSTGKSFPLSRYYKNRGDFYSLEDALKFYFESGSDSIDSPIIKDYFKDYAQLLKSVDDYEKKISEVSNRGDFDSYSCEFD